MATAMTSDPRSGEITADRLARILEQANPNVLRMALYEATRDPELTTMKVERLPFWGGAFKVATLAPEHVDTVRGKALDFLLRGAPVLPAVRSDEEIRHMMKLLLADEIADFTFKFGRGDLNDDPFPLGVEWNDEPSAEIKQAFKVAVIGAGLGGLTTAIQLDRLGIPYVMLERNPEIGGTWWTNDYPECRVDTASHHYQYSFMKNYPWKHYFATQGELLQYAKDVADAFDLMRKIRLNTALVGAEWDAASARWVLRLHGPDGREETMSVNAVISCVGLFHTPNVPDIAGIETFRGEMFHTTQWDHGCDLTGKRVAQIGVGSTGAQLMPAVAREASHLTIFQRSPQWVSQIEGYRTEISQEVQWLFDNLPYYWNWFSFFTTSINMGDPEGLQNIDHEWVSQGGMISERNDNLRNHNIEYIKAKVGHDPELVKKLTPDFPPFARRPVVDNGWFDTLNRDNVDLVSERIDRITATGLMTEDGIEREFDVLLICAGFKVDRYLWPVEYKGEDGLTLEEAWERDGARAYLGITMPKFPNLFVVLGPNGQGRAGGLIKWLELWTGYALKCVVKLIESGHKAMSVKPEVFEDYNQRLDEALKICIWDDAESYYVNKHGRQNVNMPWKPAQYFEMVSEASLDDYEVR